MTLYIGFLRLEINSAFNQANTLLAAVRFTRRSPTLKAPPTAGRKVTNLLKLKEGALAGESKALEATKVRHNCHLRLCAFDYDSESAMRLLSFAGDKQPHFGGAITERSNFRELN